MNIPLDDLPSVDAASDGSIFFECFLLLLLLEDAVFRRLFLSEEAPRASAAVSAEGMARVSVVPTT